MEGQIVTNPELLDDGAGHCARASEAVRHPARDGDDDAGDLRRRAIRASHRWTSTRTWFRSSAAKKTRWRRETQKILGDFREDHVAPLAAKVSAQCNRVPVVDGHTLPVSVELEKKPAENEIIGAMRGWRGIPQTASLPSAPPCPVIYMEEHDRPQPRRDVERENGMAVFIGRLRKCPVLDYKFIALGHNTVRGAAGAAVLNAELMKAEGWLDK